jgi:hypothetical protein
MKNTIIAVLLLAICFILACTKESSPVNDTPAPQATVAGHSSARYAGPNYSQSIPVDTANAMILSYLNSVRYPYADTALRSLSFDADTLRAYLQNPNIETVKLMFAHQPAYKNSANNGKYSGMKPEALTVIVVGINGSGQYVRNSQNGVYEHLMPCPLNCPGISNAIIQ